MKSQTKRINIISTRKSPRVVGYPPSRPVVWSHLTPLINYSRMPRTLCVSMGFTQPSQKESEWDHSGELTPLCCWARLKRWRLPAALLQKKNHAAKCQGFLVTAQLGRSRCLINGRASLSVFSSSSNQSLNFITAHNTLEVQSFFKHIMSIHLSMYDQPLWWVC